MSIIYFCLFFFKQKTAYEMRISDWSSDVCSSDLCPFDEAPAKSDEEGLIVARGKTSYALLNLFPYNSGHLLVCPYRHIATYDEATAEEVAEIGELTQTAMRVLRAVSRWDGFNIGMNQRAVAGAATGRASCREGVCQAVEITLV